MRRLVLPGEPTENGEGGLSVTIAGVDHHYLTRVLRMNVDTQFEAIDPAGMLVRCTLRKSDSSSCLLDVEYLDRESERNEPRITLFIGLLKGRKMDLVVRQATECGVARIVPLRSVYSIADIPKERIDVRIRRWERIAKEAMQQSGNRIRPEISIPVEPAMVGELWERRGPGYVCHPVRPEKPTAVDNHTRPPGEVALGIGPEGGFDQNEIGRFIEAGFQPFYLGDRVLRSETAVVFTIGAIRNMLWVR